jgi:hypothetical protein
MRGENINTITSKSQTTKSQRHKEKLKKSITAENSLT